MASAQTGSTQMAAPDAAPPQPPRAASPRIGRWLDAQTLALNLRYREIESSEDVVTTNQVQHQEQIRFRIKFDREARYSVHLGIFSGANFGGGWNSTGIGTGEFTHRLDVKQLFVVAQPLRGLELQAGSLYLWRGESTEITSYDNDGYITGARVIVRRPRELFFEELTYAQANLGDVDQPNAFRRFDSIGDVNYRQAGAVKAITKRAAVSVDFTTASDIRTLRAGGRVETGALRVVDVLRMEGYRRLNGDREAGGFAIAGEKAVTTRFEVAVGLSSTDEHLTLNGDRYGRGNHLFLLAAYRLSDEWSVQTFVAAAIHKEFAVANNTRVDVVVSYNLLRTLQRLRVLP